MYDPDDYQQVAAHTSLKLFSHLLNAILNFQLSQR
jgi:Ca2+-binding EF-hand superfamily protein